MSFVTAEGQRTDHIRTAWTCREDASYPLSISVVSIVNNSIGQDYNESENGRVPISRDLIPRVRSNAGALAVELDSNPLAVDLERDVTIRFLEEPKNRDYVIVLYGSHPPDSRETDEIRITVTVTGCTDAPPAPPDPPACSGNILLSFTPSGPQEGIQQGGIYGLEDETGGVPCAVVERDVEPDAINGAFPTDPAVSPDGNLVAYVANDSPNVLLAVFDRGKEERRVIADTGRYSAPEFSPNGRWLACTSGGDTIVVFDLETLDFVTHAGGASPTWSADSTQLAYVSISAAEILVLDVADAGSGSAPTLGSSATSWLTIDDPGSAVQDVAWSPDGSRIAFTAGPINLSTSNYTTRLYVVETSGAPYIAFAGNPVTTDGDANDADRKPAWFTDDTILFLRDAGPPLPPEPLGESTLEIVTITDGAAGPIEGSGQSTIDVREREGGPAVVPSGIAVPRGS